MKSLRGRRGQEIVLFDGNGVEAVGAVVAIQRRSVHVEVGELRRRDFELAHRITLAIALSKGHRQGYTIEKCTELGVAAIQPVVTERSVARPDAEACEKWRRRAVEAAKQSERAYVPSIEPPIPLAAAITSIPKFAAAAVADPWNGAVRFQRFLSRQSADASVIVFIGPEGGFTEDERQRLIAAGATPCSLAPTILRTETAAVAVCAAAAMVDVGAHSFTPADGE